jgi:integrase
MNSLNARPANLSVFNGVKSTAFIEQARSQFQDEYAKVNLALCSFLNMTADAERWKSSVQKLLMPSAGKAHVFDTSFDFRVKGLQGRMRDVRGFLDVSATHAKPLPTLPQAMPARVRDLYASLRPESVKVAAKLPQWVQGIRWYGHMHLPPLVASHIEGSLNDQSVQGPLARTLGWTESETTVKTRAAKGIQQEADDEGQGLQPFALADTESAGQPFGWLPAMPHTDSQEGKWLQAFLWESVGGPSATTTQEDLSDGLMDALDVVPKRFRKKTVALIAYIRNHHGLSPDDRINSLGDQVDRQVVDFGTYNAVLDALKVNCITNRMPERQIRMRLLIVLAFRFGMRRREMLFLRRGDIDLPGDGRIHIRPYTGHSLKTGFSRRSLPIVPLLNEQEHHWLVQACDECVARQPSEPLSALLFPEHEHDTLTRDAISLLRRIGKDDRLKLHHLRHSFASWMTLKIVFARRPEWANVFAGHPEIHQEMRNSPALVGSILKPLLSAGDFLVIPRMLGHSSYEVSLTNYVHTLDLVAALYVHHELADEIVPNRYLGRLTSQRFTAATTLRKESVGGYRRPESTRAQSVDVGVPPVPWSTLVREALIAQAENGAVTDLDGLSAEPSPPSMAQIRNWHSPLHALGLRDRLIAGIDLLDASDVALMADLGELYWHDNPPMFWFNPRQVNRNQASQPQLGESVSEAPALGLAKVQLALGQLLQLLRRMGLTDAQVFFWRYKKSPSGTHDQMWSELIAAQGFTARYRLLSGTAIAVDALGVSLGMNNTKRSPLPGVLWRTLARLLAQMR